MHAKKLYLTMFHGANGYQYINANVDIFRKDSLTGATYPPIRCVMNQDHIVHAHIQSGIIKGRGQSTFGFLRLKI